MRVSKIMNKQRKAIYNKVIRNYRAHTNRRNYVCH